MRRADIEVPKLPVDVDSWGRLACYPRGSFYPLSHGPSTRYRGITLSGFRPCSTCMSRSQATLCQCTLRLISIQPEVTFERLRYSLGGDRPSQTAHQTLSPHRLDTKLRQGGISRATPPELAPGVHSLPPILHSLNLESVPSYSKAPGVFLSCCA